MKKTLTIFAVLAISILTLSGCAEMLMKAKPPIIITGPQGVVVDDSYKIVKITNIGSVFWRFWVDGQQVVIYPGRFVFVKHGSNFWKMYQKFWVHAYLEVFPDGRVNPSTFAGERLVDYQLNGKKWVCSTGQTIGAEIVLGDPPGANYPGPTKFNGHIPIIMIPFTGTLAR